MKSIQLAVQSKGGVSGMPLYLHLLRYLSSLNKEDALTESSRMSSMRSLDAHVDSKIGGAGERKEDISVDDIGLVERKLRIINVVQFMIGLSKSG